MSCSKVIIFYEKHNEKHPAQVINTLTPLLKKSGVKAYCFEEPSHISKQDLLKIYLTNMKDLARCTKIENIFDECSKGLISHEELAKNMDHPDMPSLKQRLLAYVKKTSQDWFESLKETVLLLKKTDSPDLSFCTMDMSPKEINAIKKISSTLDLYKERDHYMEGKILDQCNSNGDVLALVGPSHFSIATLLRKKDIEVKEYYVKASPTSDFTGNNIGDLCLNDRNPSKYKECNGYQNNVVTIDLFAEPHLNAVNIIGNDLGLFDL